MSKSNVVSIVNFLSLSGNDANSTDQYYDDTIKDFSQMKPFTNITLVSLTAETSQYTLPDDVVNVEEMFYDSTIIQRTDTKTLNTLNHEWRDQTGPPVAYITEEETSKQFRLYPNPDTTSKDFIFLFGEPFGRDFPEYSVGIAHTEIRDDNPDWMDFLLALKVTSKEHQRDSDIMDPNFAKLTNELADLLISAGAVDA